MLNTPLMSFVHVCFFAPYVVFLVLLGMIPPPLYPTPISNPQPFKKIMKIFLGYFLVHLVFNFLTYLPI
jgi:hypothetical protein